MNPRTYVVSATSNRGKMIEIPRLFGLYGIPVFHLHDFVSKKLDVEETGSSLGENAIIKVQAYAQELFPLTADGSRFIVISDDTGNFIDGLNGEPGIHVRRWKGYKMTDEEIIEHCLSRMQGLTGAQRNATFRTNLAVVIASREGITEPTIFEGELPGRILEKADPNRVEGFPFESLFFATEWNKVLGELHRMSDEEKRKGYFNHRERAIQKAVPFIKKHLS